MLASPAVPCEAEVRCSDWLWLWLEVTLLVSKGSSGSGPGSALSMAGGGGELIGHGAGVGSASSAKFLNLFWCICTSSAGGAFAFGLLGGALAGRCASAAGCVVAAANGGVPAAAAGGVKPSSDWVSKQFSTSCTAMASRCAFNDRCCALSQGV